MRGLFKGKINKVILSIVTLVFVASNFYFLIFYSANEANAQQVVIDPTQAAIQIPWKGLEIAQISLDEILNDLKATFFKNVVANLSRSFAKSYSQFLVTGAKGGKPFWETNVWDSIKNQGDAAFEDWLTAAISNGIGLDLCKFDPTLTLNIALTLPNKSDKSKKIKKEKTVLGAAAADGCSFEDLKDKFSNDSPQWQDFIKIKATEIGDDFRVTIDQLSRDISLNQNLKQNNAGAPNFSSPPPVLSDLTTKTNALGSMRNELDSDITIMIDKRGTKEPVQLSIGSYILAPEYVSEIKAAWVKKIGAGRSEANTKKAAYRGCFNKDITTVRLDPCDRILNDLGYNPVPGQNWVDENNKTPADKAQQFVREAQSKMETAYDLYNSLSNGYEGLYKFINNQIKAEMFESGGLYTYQTAKTQFQPQADPAAATQQQVEAGTTKAKATAEERKKTEISTTGGWKNSVETISDYIKTPAELLKAKSIESLAKGDSAATFTKSIVADSLGIFLQEMYNMYINQLLLALSNPKKQKSTKGGNTFNAEKQSMVTEEGVNLYYDSLSPESTVTLPDLDLLQAFQTKVVGNKINPNIYNNVIDLNFAMAITQRMSIGAAIDSGKINGSYGFSAAETLEANKYNLSNIRKLRKARVVPLGLELAAELIRDCAYKNGSPAAAEVDTAFYDQRMNNCPFVDTKLTSIVNATLKDVVDGFSNRGVDGICRDTDADDSPFCNLVDPDWILKIPATKCLQASSTEAYSEILQDNNTGTRYARCADFISCLTDDTAKNCGSAEYGLCVKEKNVWRLGGETCEAQYDSCRAYTTTDSRGEESEVAFLKNTLDPSGCSPDTVGCKAYARSYDNLDIYFNRNVQTCEDKAEGCHEFITDQSTLNALIDTSTLPTGYDDAVLATRVYYKINPACDVNPEGANCSGFMTKCSASQVGCAAFAPVSGGAVVSAVLNQEDQCPAECNGFSAYFRQPTNFEPVSQLAYFVNNNTVKTCKAANVGCAEFTNLEKINTGTPVAEALEYYTSLRQCIKPGSGLNEKTFFTWQSIASGPQQVIRHLLQADGTGAPMTIDGSDDCLGDVNAANYCLKFYDVAGNTYYRDIRKTIIVSATGCYPLRKTNSNLAICGQTNGTWTDNYCTYNAYVPSATEAASAGFGEKSQTCSAVENGCFNYLAASGNNIYNVFYDDFNDGTSPEYDEAGVSISEESLIPSTDENDEDKQYSLNIYNNAQAVRTVEITAGKYYVLEFLAKGAGSAEAPTTFRVQGFGDVSVTTNDWFAYTLGPIKLDTTLYSLVFENLTGAAIFIDNVSLVQYKANYYLIENSWAPVGCGIEDLNCEAYNGPNDQTFYIKQFSNLCPVDKIGCQYLLDTRNSVNPQSQNFSGLIVPADNLTSYVVKSEYKCEVEAKGCEKFSEPTYQAGTGLVYDDVILKNDPEQYLGVRSILCTADAAGCTELINEKGYPEYYKIDPAKICQYENSGWYLSDSEGATPCNPAAVAPNYNIFKVTDLGYAGNTGACPSSAANCSGFQTIDQQGEPTDQIYYVIDNENNINRTGCSSVGTDWNKGCVAFKNTISNSAETIKVTKDRDCAQWVNCSAKDNVGNCLTMELINDDPSGPGLKLDKVRYSSAAAPLVISRNTYNQRFQTVQNVTAKDIWDAGDYSGYTIPDRYPIETELTKKFTTYPREAVTTDDTDSRFTSPVCKIFPAEDSPVPRDLVFKLGYSKITNVYSQSVTLEQVADGCNYQTADAGGVTTYFPYGFLKETLGAKSPKICTGKTSINGKLCQNAENDTKPNGCKTFAEDTSDEESDGGVASTAYGKCQGVENLVTNVGIQSRCLEMDLLNPLYGNIKPGDYACLSYFPFQYDECAGLSDQTGCERLPNCSWIISEGMGAGGISAGVCSSDYCKFKHNKTECESLKMGDAADDPRSCLWDGAEQKCIFRICSLSDPANKRECESLSKYCKWYGPDKNTGQCLEDICSPPYSNLIDLQIASHPEPDADLCMNPGSVAAFVNPASRFYDPNELYNQTLPGRGDYCEWQARTQADPDKHGRWLYSCQLQCGLKYPNDTDQNYKNVCDADPYCKWGVASCENICDAANDALDPAVTCNSSPQCTWNEAGATCISKCLGLTTEGSSDPITFADSPCGDAVANGVEYCTKNADYKCASACDGKGEAECLTAGEPDGGCTWNNTSRICQPTCRTLTKLQCTTAPFNEYCGMKDGNCITRDAYVCTYGGRNILTGTEGASCSGLWGCEIKYPTCLPKNYNCTAKTTEVTCAASALGGNCVWGTGKCITEKDQGGCSLHAFAVSPENLDDFGASCRAGVDGIVSTNPDTLENDDCTWGVYTYKHKSNIGCLPPLSLPPSPPGIKSCYECGAAVGTNLGCTADCN
jgi:hypothetical protein